MLLYLLCSKIVTCRTTASAKFFEAVCSWEIIVEKAF